LYSNSRMRCPSQSPIKAVQNVRCDRIARCPVHALLFFAPMMASSLGSDSTPTCGDIDRSSAGRSLLQAKYGKKFIFDVRSEDSSAVLPDSPAKDIVESDAGIHIKGPRINIPPLPFVGNTNISNGTEEVVWSNYRHIFSTVTGNSFINTITEKRFGNRTFLEMLSLMMPERIKHYLKHHPGDHDTHDTHDSGKHSKHEASKHEAGKHHAGKHDPVDTVKKVDPNDWRESEPHDGRRRGDVAFILILSAMMAVKVMGWV